MAAMFTRRRLIMAAGAGSAATCGLAYQFIFKKKDLDVDFMGDSTAGDRRKIQRFASLLDRGDNPQAIKTRDQQVDALKSGEEFDIVIVGGGCTGAGAALDATTRGLKVACIERGDFANETSSRSSKLIWGGFKYLQVAIGELLAWKSLKEPVTSFKKFWHEFYMVYECCSERSWLAGMQPHLVRYVPQAVPFFSWFVWPPFFDHPFYSVLPMMALPGFWFYDALAGFNSPTSYAMGPKKTREVFPQLNDVLYSAVYCEAMHNDARTGTSIALTAAMKGSTIANYVEMTGMTYGGEEGHTCTGIKVKDKMSGEDFEIKAKAVVLCTGAWLDEARRMDDPDAEKAVAAAAGVHIVLPGYFTPGNMGFANLRTARGATMYFLPWLGHTIVGSTDKKCDPISSPAVTEDEIQYLVNEAASCLTPAIRVRRSDVLSAWQGWRPLYRDPNAAPGTPVSRHHAIGTDPKTGITFICGGKWSTYRAMAEELIDKVIAHKKFQAGPCITKRIKLIGGEGYHELLHVQLVQKYGIAEDQARHLTATYGTCSFALCEQMKPISEKSGKAKKFRHKFGIPLAEGFPYCEGEISYCCKYEMVQTIKDMLTLRMRLAYINSQAALDSIPRVAELMQANLGWSDKEKERQIAEARQYIGQFGGPIADKTGANIRAATLTDLHEVFEGLDKARTGYLDLQKFNTASIKLGFPFKNNDDLKKNFEAIDINGRGRISELEFIEWWNRATPSQDKLAKKFSLSAANEVALDKSLFDDDDFKKPAKKV